MGQVKSQKVLMIQLKKLQNKKDSGEISKPNEAHLMQTANELLLESSKWCNLQF